MMILRKEKILLLALFISLIISSGDIKAQSSTVSLKEEQSANQEDDILKDNVYFFDRSLFFTMEEQAMVKRALSGIVVPTLPGESNRDPSLPPLKPGVIKLAGVLFTSPVDWVLWLNGKRVSPKALLPEIIDIRVEKDRVFLKWYDAAINDIISITLRPHQVYDIQTGMLLPG